MRGSRLRRESIYIPIWLDLLLTKSNLNKDEYGYLHSNMVRFIIGYIQSAYNQVEKFTFQYG